MKIESLCIHGGISEDKFTGAVSVPIYQTSTFRFDEIGKDKGYAYTRSANPTRDAVEALVAELEGGVAGFAFGSGMAAIAATIMLLKSGSKILIGQNIYGGTFRILNTIFKDYNVNYEIVDMNDFDALELAFTKDKTIKALIIESPTNPTLTIMDIKAIASIAGRHSVLTIVDNTFMTPYLQKPLELGADIVIHSGTKYLGGHSDVVSGFVVTKTAELAKKIKFIQSTSGGILSPMDCWLVQRGIKTLAVRMDRHLENTAFLADKLRQMPEIEKIFYPGFKDFAGYEINQKQSRGAGALISFILSSKVDINNFAKSLKLITFAESLGGVESLMNHSYTMSHGSVPKEVKAKMGITQNLLRFSVGIENKQDILEDLKTALL